MILKFKHFWKSWDYEIESENISNVYDYHGKTIISVIKSILDAESFRETDIETSESYEQVMKKINEAKFNKSFEDHLK